MTLGWPNEFLVVISINDAVNLPPKSHPHKGVFGYKELNLCLLWTCAPTVGLEVERQYAMLRLRLHTPMRCFPTGPMRQAVMEGVYLVDPFDTGMVLKPTKVDYEAHKGEDGTVYQTGNMILYIDSNPTDPVFSCFWYSPKARFLKGKVGDKLVRLELCEPCNTCGAEFHKSSGCTFDDIIDNIGNLDIDADIDEPTEEDIQIIGTSKVIPAWQKTKPKQQPNKSGRQSGKDKSGAKRQGKRK
ncbi:hypothetical protein BY996DRAFT_3781353 [Phakopsora pachyrhizi]|uniref:Expressed protein n=1 Tax=Phakopsora pachyrhizi TaxID=170000 RepID=A0AAV0BK15_PHAPC|nr:hypothetical protein BY996DRAFT_3781353 [Phakopsora pachyrhizi]CAH7687343.1 expressed protein [Phakopsora pachyrhizi]